VRDREPERRPASQAQPARRRPPRRNRAGRLLIALLLLAAGAVAAFAAISALDNGGIDAPNQSDVNSQVQDLKDLVRQYAE
jgi:ferric-dicitrate binding protein FerR (iron transport regulator)